MKKLLSLIIALMLLPGVPRYIGAEEQDWSHLTDASSMTDEEFFGKWNEEYSEWSVKPKFNYAGFPDMKPVEEAAKKGEYKIAKSELLYYMKNRETLFDSHHSSSNFAFADLWRDNIIVRNGDTVVGDVNVGGGEFKDYIFDASGVVTRRGSYSFMLMQRYKVEEAAEIMTRESGYAPELEIRHSGKISTYKAVKDAYTHYGDFTGSHGREEYMYAKESIDPDESNLYRMSTGPDSKRSYIQFNVSGLSKDEKIDNAFIKIRARSLGEATRVVMFGYGSTIWKEDTLSWQNAETTVISFNEAKENPDNISTADFDYIPTEEHGYIAGIESNLARWQWVSILAGCYNTSGDEAYAENLINHTNKFIESARDNVGQYTGNQDVSMRLNLFVNEYHDLLSSPHMDPDSSAAWIKFMWQSAKYLSYPVNYRPDHNHGCFCVRGQQKVVIYMPEFNEYEEWKEMVVYRWNELARNLMANTDYREGTTGYANTVLNIFNNVIVDLDYYGIEIGEDFKKYTRKLAAYIAMVAFPNKKIVQMGDSGNATATSYVTKAAEILDDDELYYMITNGEKGEYPGFDSIHIGGRNNIAIMRSGWGENDLYAFINAASADGRSHTHPDNLSLDVYAYGRPLIVDSGLKNYNDDDVSNWLRLTTEAHNTVTIDKKAQSTVASGSVTLFNTNKYFDTYKGREGTVAPFVHNRNIMFVKPCFWIVSDHVSGTDGEVHTYDQNWHFSDGSGLKLSGDVASTNFETGADIEIVNVENPNVASSLQDGYYGSGDVHEVEYLRFAQEITEEPVFDTVLFPKEKGKPYEVSTERIDLGIPLSTASAYKMSYTVNGRSADAVVYTSHEENPSERQITGQYLTDARQIYIEQDKEGNLSAVNMSNGGLLTRGDKSVISFTDARKVDDISVVYDSDKVEIFSQSMGADALALLNVYADKDYREVYFNDSKVLYNIENGIISFGTASGEKIEVSSDGSAMKGTVTEDITTEGEYLMDGDRMTARLTFAKDSILTGSKAWDGTLPKPQETTSNADVDGDIVGAVGFTAYDIASDKPMKLILPYDDLYEYVYIKDSAVNELDTDKNVNVTYNKETVEIEFLKGLLDIVIYKEKKQNNSTSGRPSGGGGGGGGGAPSVPAPTPTPTPDVPTTPTEADQAEEKKSFKDAVGHWAEADIIAMAEKAVVKGDEEGNFNPDSFVTRAEFCAFITRFASLSEKTTDAFSDVDAGKWYAKSIGAAYEAGIVSGDGDTFRPEDKITREEAAAILSRLEAVKNAEIKNAAAVFTDDGEISPWAKTAVDTMTALGIISGIDEGVFAPKAEMTRAMTVVMLARIDKL